jgi:hypothetical protein
MMVGALMTFVIRKARAEFDIAVQEAEDGSLSSVAVLVN